MKISFDNGKTWAGESQGAASPENAAKRLRNRINETLHRGLGVRHIRHVGWIAWRAIRTFVYWGLFLFAVAIAFWPDAHNSATAVSEVFIIGTALLLIWTYLDIRKHFNIHIFSSKQQHGILIGQSYRHFAESGNPSAVEVGEEAKTYVDYLTEPNPHVMMLGSTSSGKTTTMRSFISRVAINDKVPFLVIDWNGENEEWAREAGAVLWKVPEHFKVNLFRLNGLSKEARASIAMENLAIAAKLTALQATRVKTHLLRFYMDGKEPSLFELWKAICVGKASKANVLDQRLRAIQRVIGSEPDEFWDGVFARNNIVSLQGLNESEKSLVSYAILQRITEQFDKNPNKDAKPRLLVAMDEAWQPQKGQEKYKQEKESAAERIVRLGRKYGIGVLVSTQQLEDLPKVFYNSSSLVMLHQHREASYHGKDILQLDSYEQEYIKNAAQGEMLLLDRGQAQSGNPHSQYVRVTPLSSSETQVLAGLSNPYSPERITEPEMPIEMHDNGVPVQAEGKEEGEGALKGVDMPSVAVYRYMVALSRTGSVRGANRMVQDNGWLTSKPSIYGKEGKPSIFERAQNGGYVDQDGVLTVKGRKVIDPNEVIAKQGVLAGSEEHKELMRKAILAIQDNGNFAFTRSDKDSFDIGEIKAKTKSSWNTGNLTIYECQTNSMKSEIDKCISRAKRFKAKLVFVAVKQIADIIKEVAGERYEYVSLQ